jgi:phosphotransacetylase
MKIRLLACEPNDTRVTAAIRLCPPDLNFCFTETPPGIARSSSKLDPYEAAPNALHDGTIDVLIAGAGIALSEFLPMVFSTFSTSRSQHLLYSAAPIEPITRATPFLLVDPCVIPSPQPEELAVMAEGASKLYRALYAKEDPFVAILSHATGSYKLHRDRLAATAI